MTSIKSTGVTLFIVLFAIGILSIEEFGFCHYFLGFETGCLLKVDGIYEVVLFSFIALTLPIIFTTPFKDHVFTKWSQFATFALPLGVVTIAWLEYSNSQSGGGFMSFSISPILVGFLLVVYYSISLTIIFRAWRASK